MFLLLPSRILREASTVAHSALLVLRWFLMHRIVDGIELLSPLLQLCIWLWDVEESRVQTHHRETYRLCLLLAQDAVQAALLSKAHPHFSARSSPGKFMPGIRHRERARVLFLPRALVPLDLRGVINSSIEGEMRWQVIFLPVLPIHSLPSGQPLERSICGVLQPALD